MQKKKKKKKKKKEKKKKKKSIYIFGLLLKIKNSYLFLERMKD